LSAGGLPKICRSAQTPHHPLAVEVVACGRCIVSSSHATERFLTTPAAGQSARPWPQSWRVKPFRSASWTRPRSAATNPKALVVWSRTLELLDRGSAPFVNVGLKVDASTSPPAKLALVVRGTCDEPLLDSYSSERSKVGDEVLKGAERLTSHKVGHPRSVLNQNRASERRTPLTLQRRSTRVKLIVKGSCSGRRPG
jgi:hypothetical protein